MENTTADTVHRAKGAFGKRANYRDLAASARGETITIHHYDEVEDKTTLETVQDVSPILKANAIARNSGRDGYTPSRDLKHVANIPNVTITELYKRGINIMSNADWPKIAAMLDDNDFIAFRTSGGKIAKRAWRQYFTKEGKRH